MRSLPSSSQAVPTWNYAWLGGGGPASPSTSTVPAVPDCTGKALESARVISPEIGGWAPGCPLSSSYQPYSVTQTHYSGAKFDLLHEVLRSSPWSIVECEASSWPDDPPCISASFPTSPVHFRTPLLLPASLLGSLRLCCPFCWVLRLNQAQPNILASCSSSLTVVMAPGHGSIPLWSSLALHFPEIAHFHIFLNLEQLRYKGPGSHLGLQCAPPASPQPKVWPCPTDTKHEQAVGKGGLCRCWGQLSPHRCCGPCLKCGGLRRVLRPCKPQEEKPLQQPEGLRVQAPPWTEGGEGVLQLPFSPPSIVRATFPARQG